MGKCDPLEQALQILVRAGHYQKLWSMKDPLSYWGTVMALSHIVVLFVLLVLMDIMKGDRFVLLESWLHTSDCAFIYCSQVQSACDALEFVRCISNRNVKSSFKIHGFRPSNFIAGE